MSALCCKYAFGSSAGLAYLANKYAGAPDCTIVGGLCLNKAAGGWNPEAVRVLAEDAYLGEFRCGRIVWFPERDALGTGRMVGASDLSGYLSPFRNQRIDDGLLPEVSEILSLIAEYDLALGLSHTSPQESLALVPEARRLGVKKIIATHASSRLVGWNLDQKKEGAQLDIVFEECLITMLPTMYGWASGPCDFMADICEQIRVVGPEHYCISSDCGWSASPHPVDAMRLFIRLLVEHGFSDAEIVTMTRTNPAWLLGLD